MISSSQKQKKNQNNTTNILSHLTLCKSTEVEKNESRIKKTEQSRLKTGRGEPLHQKKKKKKKQSNYKLLFFTGKKLRLAPMRHWSRSNYKAGRGGETHTCPNLYLDQGRVATCHNYIKPSQVVATGLFMK